jgi:hypothetical protein
MRSHHLVRGVLVLFSVSPLAGCEAGERASDAPETESSAVESSFTVEGVGLSTPESVLHDERNDLYLVSNINGEPLAKAGNGFISRLRPDGSVETLKWIDGEAVEVALNAPKGMAFVGDTLFVADIDEVRAFDRESGAPLGARTVEGASFLNDLAAGPDGTLYVSDTGLDDTFSPTGTDAVYRFGDEGPVVVAQGPGLMNPNGLLVDGDALVVVPFGGADVFRIPLAGGEPSRMATLPGGQLDGVVRGDDGTLFVSSWEAGAIFSVGPDGTVGTAAEGLDSPADLGWDSERQRLLIPLFSGDAIQVEPVR